MLSHDHFADVRKMVREICKVGRGSSVTYANSISNYPADARHGHLAM